MGSLRLTLCVSAVVVGALAPMAYAADAQGVDLIPASPAPGSDVRLAVRGCPGTTGTAASDAFVAEARLVGKDGTLTGDTRVRSALQPGRYRVTVGCDGREITDVITVSDATASPSVPSASSGIAATATAPTALSSPVAPVRAGGGGTAHGSTADPRVAVPGLRHAVIGLVLVGVAAGVVVVRGARRGRGTE